ncbi:hypothetical protein I4U23_023115 [Adineta vaga]|nr:hypothetical protein I4U23_023115 [Adineta vaga]
MNAIYYNMTCIECTCSALKIPTVGWNCIQSNKTCQLFQNYSIDDIGLITVNDSTFKFQQLPPKRLSTTTTTTTTLTTVTTQNPSLNNIVPSSLTANSWTLFTYSYQATNSTTLTIKFSFQASVDYKWYVDDVSIKDSSSNEKITNGKLENSPSLTGWTTGYSGVCIFNYGITSNEYHSSSKSYYSSCITGITWISQSFNVISGQTYNISFWLYMDLLIIPLPLTIAQATVSIV